MHLLALTELLQATDSPSCEITRYTQTLLSDSHTLPGTLVGRFHTCTWETNSLDRNSHSTKNNLSKPRKNSLSKEPAARTDWYASDGQSGWRGNRNGKAMSRKAYSNGGYLLNPSMSREGSGVDVVSSKEHIVLSNVRQFVDGMKRYLLNRPDTQMMFAIQRERIKVCPLTFH